MSFQDNIESTYTAEGGEAYQTTKHEASDRAYFLVSGLRARKLQPYIRPTDRALEFGVGNGWNLAGLKTGSKLGYDISTAMADKVMSQGIQFTSDVKSLPEQGFDVVICHHVLEHVAQPQQILTTIKQLLAPQGQLLLFVPYENQWRFRKYDSNEANHHLYSWTVQTLGALVESSGFKVQEATLLPFGYERFAAKLVAKLHLPAFILRPLLKGIRTVKPAYEVKIVATSHG